MKAGLHYDVIIIGGSYAGLSAGMSLGRSLRNVVIIDSGHPCNEQTPHSHNFITHDGSSPAAISQAAKEQVVAYPTVEFIKGRVIAVVQQEKGFDVHTAAGDVFQSKKILFATGVKDIMPPLEGFKECWGISIFHCPYCHGYEVNGKLIGILANGDMAFEMTRLISNWSGKLILFTDGTSTLTEEQTKKIQSYNIRIIEQKIKRIQHTSGTIDKIELENGEFVKLDAIFGRPVFEQHCSIPNELGCEIAEAGFIKTDGFQRTTIPGIYAAGDNANFFRAVSAAVAAGNKAGAVINKDLIEESF